jgi:hypothetical protein
MLPEKRLIHNQLVGIKYYTVDSAGTKQMWIHMDTFVQSGHDVV